MMNVYLLHEHILFTALIPPQSYNLDKLMYIKMMQTHSWAGVSIVQHLYKIHVQSTNEHFLNTF